MGRYRYGRLAPAVLLSLLLTACATPPQSRGLIDDPPSIAEAFEVSHTPFYPQREYQCGPAALASVLNLDGPVATVDDLVEQVYVPQLKGSLRHEMIAAAASYGRLAIRLEGRLEKLLESVAEGYPVLVFQNLGFDQAPFWHYAVVIGYDLPGQQLVLRSGERQRLLRPFANFEKTWARAGYWAVVVPPPDRLPASVTEQAVIDALLVLENAAPGEAMVSAYRGALQRWPDSFVLLMGLGNASYALGSYPQAEQAFKQAIQVSPQRVEAWNNLAFSQLAQGRGREALLSVQRALALEPDNAELQRSEREIRSSRDSR